MVPSTGFLWMWQAQLGVEEGGTAFQGSLVGVGCPTQWPHCLAWSSEVRRIWDSTYRDRLLRSWRHFCVGCFVFGGCPVDFFPQTSVE